MPQFLYYEMHVNDGSVIYPNRLVAAVPLLNLRHPDIRSGGGVIFFYRRSVIRWCRANHRPGPELRFL